MPRKIRELIADLEAAGFTNRGGKGSHRNFVHHARQETGHSRWKVAKRRETISGEGDQRAIEESQS